jgi:hypothetical protein
MESSGARALDGVVDTEDNPLAEGNLALLANQRWDCLPKPVK